VGKGAVKATVSGDLRQGFLAAQAFEENVDPVFSGIVFARGAANIPHQLFR
jgi:hypothetical protein